MIAARSDMDVFIETTIKPCFNKAFRAPELLQEFKTTTVGGVSVAANAFASSENDSDSLAAFPMKNE